MTSCRLQQRPKRTRRRTAKAITRRAPSPFQDRCRHQPECPTMIIPHHPAPLESSAPLPAPPQHMLPQPRTDASQQQPRPQPTMTPSPVAPLVAPPDRTAAHVMEELEAAIIAGALDVNNRRHLDHSTCVKTFEALWQRAQGPPAATARLR